MMYACLLLVLCAFQADLDRKRLREMEENHKKTEKSLQKSITEVYKGNGLMCSRSPAKTRMCNRRFH